jgi:hypothetical protein
MTTDITRSTMPESKSKTFLDHAGEFLSAEVFTGVDRSELLRRMTALYLMDFKYGNKREERAACDFLNELQATAARLVKLPPATTSELAAEALRLFDNMTPEERVDVAREMGRGFTDEMNRVNQKSP